jgi:hypothetical protein
MRSEYMEASSAAFVKGDPLSTLPVHRAYYAQWVNKATIAYVVHYIGGDRIDASTDPHLNDIPLGEWDDLRPPLAAKTNDFGLSGFSLSDWVCVNKEAARQWKERKK